MIASILRYSLGTFLLITILYPFHLVSQKPTLLPFTHQELLEGRQLFSILRDHHGFLWVGCSDGLLRFDGYQFEEFHANPKDSTALQNDYINQIYEDTKGRIWVLSQDYVSVYHSQTRQFQSFPIPSQYFAAAIDIIEDKVGQMWITTAEGYGKLSLKKGWEEYQYLETVYAMDRI